MFHTTTASSLSPLALRACARAGRDGPAGRMRSAGGTDRPPPAVGAKRPRASSPAPAPASGLDAWAEETAPPPGVRVGGAEEAAVPRRPEGSRRVRKCFRYGNYHRYYGYRVGESLEDHRVAHFRREWFEGRRCLDVGCNEGLVALSVAVRFKPASMVGVDVDGWLVRKANEKLARLRRSAAREAEADEATRAATPLASGRPSAEPPRERMDERTGEEEEEDERGGKVSRPPPASSASETGVSRSALASAVDALASTSFVRGSVVRGDEDGDEAGGADEGGGAKDHHSRRRRGKKKPGRDPLAPARAFLAPNSLDAILCLSVTKWIQLNWGDEGLRRFFADAFDALTEGGVMVLEPQPWKSYARAFKKQKMPEETRRHFERIALRPTLYREYLRTTVGFKSVETLRAADLHDAQDFDRTVLLCVK